MCPEAGGETYTGGRTGGLRHLGGSGRGGFGGGPSVRRRPDVPEDRLLSRKNLDDPQGERVGTDDVGEDREKQKDLITVIFRGRRGT